MTQLETLDFKTSGEWRDWLNKNHSKVDGVWVILYKKNSKKSGLQYLEAVEEALCFGWIDSKMTRLDESTFRQRFNPRRKNSIWSKSNKELAIKLMNNDKMAKAGFDAIEEAKRSGKWQQAYTSKTTPETPYDLEEALQASQKAYSNFQTFPNSTKLMYIYWIQSSKKPETRAKRIMQIVEKAAENIKPT